jgi:predicted nucleotide-binding protein (sugar kinase/HSP70/actin superfamily)
MKPKAEIEKEIEDIKKHRLNDSMKDIRYYELKALLQQTNEIIEEIDRLPKYLLMTKKGDWGISVKELKSRIEGK